MLMQMIFRQALRIWDGAEGIALSLLLLMMRIFTVVQ